MNSKITGIMLFGSVPSPPRNPRSSISTQSARHSTIPAATAARTTRRSPVRKAIPSAASAITANRLTANPCAASKDPKLATRADRTCGCGVWDMVATMAVSVPGRP